MSSSISSWQADPNMMVQYILSNDCSEPSQQGKQPNYFTSKADISAQG